MAWSDLPIRRLRTIGEEPFLAPRLFQRMMDVMNDVWEPSVAPALTGSLYSFVPQIDLEEDERQMKVYAELPGMTESDVEIILEPGQLIVRGEKREEEHRTIRRGRGRFEERRYGSFERRIPIPTEIQEEKVEAKFDRGILTVVLPKSEQVRSQTKRIAIQGTTSAAPAQPARGARGQAAAEGTQAVQ